MNGNEIKRLIIVQQGALGDFLMTWPAIASLRAVWPEAEMLWAGSSQRLPLLRPLGIHSAPPSVHKQIRTLYLDEAHTLNITADERIIWFYLRKKPFQIKHENVFFLKGINQHSFTSPRTLFADALCEQGIPFDPDWQTRFQTVFPRQNNAKQQTILLFPGSGNPVKNWPLVQFFELGSWLEDQAFQPLMILGPVEQEKGIQPPGKTALAYPRTIQELIALLQQAAFVIGNDSGPMHLAGYMGVPGLAIFGPTSPRQWGPLGLDILTLDLPCSPCTQTARVACTDPVCITQITVDQVIERLLPCLAKITPFPKQNRVMSYPFS
jgi:ADP-heptose:LPS heptosyltransferase